MSIYPQILGVYSLEKKTDIGSGSTADQYQQKTYWYVRRTNDDEYEVQPLNEKNVPSGIKNTLAKSEFVSGYTPEPKYYEANTLPVLNSLKKKISKGEKYFDEGLLDQSEREFLKALMIDELNVEANFGLGSVYCEKKEYQKVKKVLDILLNIDESFQEEQRLRFNKLGINLRKQGLHEDAIRYYRKSLEYNNKDDHLHFNAARAYFDNGQRDKCLEHLGIALKLNPEFKEAEKFMAYCLKKAPLVEKLL
ncbi:MAG: tetratricopeptide repeat protein [Thermodesulfobacteriota bacterium]|nr:tetratricopeptide repeat protein [Thermodesulfobacteriota bacterium]